MNEAGRDLIDWCEEYGLCYISSFMRHARRGTLLQMRYDHWYERVGFLVRKSETHGMVERMRRRVSMGCQVISRSS